MGETLQRVLVIGSSGYLGSAICAGLRDHFEVFGTYKNHPNRIEGVTSFPFDLMNGEDVNQALRRFKPDAIIFTGGFTDRAYCEAHQAEAEVANFKSIALFFKVSAEPFYFFHFSCEDVFLKEAIQGKSLFKEESMGSPMDTFTRTKVQTETFMAAQRKRCFNIRLAKVFGEPFGPSVQPRFSWFEDYKEKLERKEPVRADARIKRNHVYVGDVVRATRTLLSKAPDVSTTYHWAAKEALTDAEFLKTYCEQSEIPRELVLSNVEEKVINLTLSKEKFEKDFDFKFQDPKDSIAEYLTRMRTGFTRTWT